MFLILIQKSYGRSLCYQQNFPDMSESEVLSSIMRGHESMLAVLKNRERHLQIIHSLWQNKDLKVIYLFIFVLVKE